MKYNRDEVIEKLLDDMMDTVMQWALSDYENFKQYIMQNENFGDLDDDTLKTLYENAFDEEID